MNNAPYFYEISELLNSIISVPSFSKNEDKTALLLWNFLDTFGAAPQRLLNNVYAFSENYSSVKPTILLNSHHDTVKPGKDWTKDPFFPHLEDGKLYGLGSNDAGGALTALLAAFLHFRRSDIPFNLIYAATAEEEIAGTNGIELLLPHLGNIDCAIIGEPTTLQMAIAERGLMVLDCAVHGKSGHAARNTGENAIEKAIPSLKWFMTYQFAKTSALLGPVKMTVTQIAAGSQHNVIPDECNFVADVRLNDCYTHQEIFDIIEDSCGCTISARSMRLKPSSISKDHFLVQAARKLNIPLFASPTMSDQALISAPSVKIGPGMSERSHTADEFIALHELADGINLYIALINELAKLYETLG